MVSITPYLIRAYHQFLQDSKLTPNILVDCSKARVNVPQAYIQQGKITLNISSNAANALVLGNEVLSFKARFDGKSYDITVPIDAVLGIYASENGEGAFFETQAPQQDEAPKPNLILLD